jgi:hypothetical protein
VQSCAHSTSLINIIENDAWKVNKEYLTSLGPFDVYFYDGPHETLDHYRSLIEFYPVLANEVIFIVDDWNFVDVRIGTESALAQLPIEILYKKEIFTTKNDLIPTQYHNGCCVIVFRKL